MVSWIAGAALAGAMAQTGVQEVALQPGETLLQVQAEGQATYPPDTATISIGVVSTGTTAREATDANARRMSAVIAAVRKAGIEQRYVRTQQIGVQPRFARANAIDYEGQAQITGYVANNSVLVRVIKLDISPNVVAAAFEAGANSVSGPNLNNASPDAGVDEARTDALRRAKAEADAYAKGLSMKVSRVLRVSERGNSTRYSNDEVIVYSSAHLAPPPPPPPPPPVATGEMKRTISVWIDYALTPSAP